MKATFSASKLPLLRHCQWWARAGAPHSLDESVSSAAELGTALHSVAEGTPIDRVMAETEADVDADDLKELAAVYADWWPGYAAGRRWLKEVPFAFDVERLRARILDSGGQGDYPDVTPYEVPGTADAVAADEVLDIKTGQAPKTLREYRGQVEHAAVCLAAITGASTVRATIAHVTPDGVFVSTDVLDALDLADAVERLRANMAAIETAVPRPGPWCREKWCPALATCPMVQGPLALVPAATSLPLIGEVESDADAALLHDALPRFEAWVKDRKAAVKRRALTRGGIDFPDGRRLVISRASRETLRLDVPGAFDVLRDVLGDVAAESAITMKTSGEAVKRAARAAGMPIEKTRAAVTDGLRRIGAVKVSEYDEIEVKQPALPATGTER